MSGVLPASWQGRRCALPLHPSGGCHIHHPEPSEICIADCGAGGMCQRNAWPLHHQSGSVPAPRHPITKGRLRSPLEPIAQPYADWMSTIVFARWITSRGVPAPCNPVHAKFSPHSLLIAQQSSNFLLGELCIHWLHSCHVREGFRLSNSGGTPAARTVLAGMSIQ